MIDKNEIEQLKKSTDIVSIISQFVRLEKKGNNYMGSCPFGHSDSNPSFSVNKDMQIYKCFSCGKAGDVFTFFMDYERLSYPDSIKKVANLTNFKLTNIKTNERIVDNVLYNIYQDASKIYINNLKTEMGKDALEYLNNRGIDNELIKTFKIGYSLKQRDTLVKTLLNKKYKLNDMINSGLLIKTDDGITDIYSSRVMFPIQNLDGKIVGFSGRTITNDKIKYINTKQTEIFKKGELIYNYSNALSSCRTIHKVIIMEGFMDVIKAYKYGIKNCVAMMGTAVTKFQATNIMRMAEEVILCFDGDSAGAHATLECSNKLLEFGVTPKIVRLSDNLDPDEYLTKYGKEQFDNCINNPMNVMDFKLLYFKQDKNLNSIDDKKLYIKQVLDELKNVKDEILIDLTLNKLSEETGINKQTIKLSIDKEITITPTKETTKLNKYELAEQKLLAYMLKYDDVIRLFIKKNVVLSNKEYRNLSRRIIDYYKENRTINYSDFIGTINLDTLNTVYNLNKIKINDKYSAEEIIDYINLIDEYTVKLEIDRLMNLIKNEPDPNKKIELSEKIRKIRVERCI